MNLPTFAQRVVSATADQDRVSVRTSGETLVVVLADGAGGVSGGREAAERIVSSDLGVLTDADACVAALRRLDAELHADRACGESTAVIVVFRGRQYFGASVGDSGVWNLHLEAVFDMTKPQHRKPFLGSGRAQPVGFGPHGFSDRVLVASDGLLLAYVPRPRLKTGLTHPLETRCRHAHRRSAAAFGCPSG